MRTILIAVLLTTGIGLVGTSGASAAPANGAAIGEAAAAAALNSQVRHYRGHRHRYYARSCFSKCYFDVFLGRRVCRTYC